MSIFNKTVSAGNLFNGAIDQYSRRIAIGSQHFQRTLRRLSFFLLRYVNVNVTYELIRTTYRTYRTTLLTYYVRTVRTVRPYRTVNRNVTVTVPVPLPTLTVTLTVNLNRNLP